MIYKFSELYGFLLLSCRAFIFLGGGGEEQSKRVAAVTTIVRDVL